MQGKMLILRPGMKKPEATSYNNPLPVDEIKKALLGAWLELVPGFVSIEHDGELHDCVAFVDEEGKLSYRTSDKKADRPDATNNWASLLWDSALRRAGHPGLLDMLGRGNAVDWLVGNVVIVYGDREFMDAL